MAGDIADLIARKRDGGELSAAEIAAMIAPDVPDYQLSAFLMAVVLRGLSDDETRGLLDAMVASGQRVSWPWPVADKHSTGGVGDSTTLVLAPLLAACGVLVAKMSGRGLGHTGGTLDKLEAIPGMRVSLSLAGHAPAGASRWAWRCAARRRSWPRPTAACTRSATSPRPSHSMPLIAASIMSKKVAAGASRLLLDVKVGEGALLPDPDAARELAGLMVRLGRGHDIDTRALLSNMSEPLGAAVGDALEVAEAVDTLRGHGPADITELCVHQAAVLAGDESVVRRALDSGAAYERYQRWVAAQGGDPEAPLPRAPLVVEVPAPRSGVVQRCHARGVGEQVMRLGAGRATQGGRRRPRGRHPRAPQARRPRSRRASRWRRCTPAARPTWMRWPRASRSATRRPSGSRCCWERSMPELPEVETVRRGLVKVLVGRELVGVDIRDGRLTAPADPMAVAHELLGAVVTGVGRRGKYLAVGLDDGRTLVCHLRMTGWFHHVTELTERPHLRAVFELDDGTWLLYSDQRRFGTMRLIEPGGLDEYWRGRVGPEPLDGAWTAQDLRAALRGRTAPVKALLLDQRVVAGVGNIYADEALWEARVHPLTPGGRLGRGAAGRVHDAVIAVLERGIDAQGASIDTYRSVDGTPGSMQERFNVFDRAGEPCPRCGVALSSRPALPNAAPTYVRDAPHGPEIPASARRRRAWTCARRSCRSRRAPPWRPRRRSAASWARS